MWFNDCVLGKSGQIVNPLIAMVDPVPYYSVQAGLCLRILLIASTGIRNTRNSQSIDIRKLKPTYGGFDSLGLLDCTIIIVHRLVWCLFVGM